MLKKPLTFITIAICLAGPLSQVFAAASAPGSAYRIVMNFNSDWLFARGDIPGGQTAALDESAFKRVCLPHTVAVVKHRDIDTSVFATISWYRRHFTPPINLQGRRFSIEFQGVSKAATVYLNGRPVGGHEGAYTPFTLDITRELKFGADNILAVRVDSRQRKDIPPEGAAVDYMVCGGIVRDVAMIVTDPLHVQWVYVTRDSADPSCIDICTQVANGGGTEKGCTLVGLIVDSSNAVVDSGRAGGTVASGSEVEFNTRIGPIPGLRLWNPDHPYLYTALMQLQDDGRTVDTCRRQFGVRTIKFSRVDGRFSINGDALKLRGLNRHETYPFIGRAAADRLQARDADILKYELGCNIVRCSHYPQSPAFLQRCDEIGLLVLEEMPGWLYVGNAAWQALALDDVRDMVMRDRNHPSVVSFGVRVNESMDYHDFYVKANRIARLLDPSRPTNGVRVAGRGSPREFMEDLWGQNFGVPPGTPQPMPMLVTESVGHRGSAHSWDDDSRLIRQFLMNAAAQDSAAANPEIAGLLGWCAFDYNSPYFTAEKKVNYHGVADIFRIPKFAGYFYRSQADPGLYGPMVFIAHRWEKAQTPDDVWVASNCGKVELFVNGVSLGRRAPSRFMALPHPLFLWKSVPFRAGEIKAVGYIGDKPAATCVRYTPGAPVRLAMIPDDTVLEEGGDMTRIAVTAVDAHGQAVPHCGRAITLSVSGAGEFLGESPVALEDGKTAFYVKTPAHRAGEIDCRASAAGLVGAQARIRVRGDQNRKDQW